MVNNALLGSSNHRTMATFALTAIYNPVHRDNVTQKVNTHSLLCQNNASERMLSSAPKNVERFFIKLINNRMQTVHLGLNWRTDNFFHRAICKRANDATHSFIHCVRVCVWLTFNAGHASCIWNSTPNLIDDDYRIRIFTSLTKQVRKTTKYKTHSGRKRMNRALIPDRIDGLWHQKARCHCFALGEK